MKGGSKLWDFMNGLFLGGWNTIYCVHTGASVSPHRCSSRRGEGVESACPCNWAWSFLCLLAPGSDWRGRERKVSVRPSRGGLPAPQP